MVFKGHEPAVADKMYKRWEYGTSQLGLLFAKPLEKVECPVCRLQIPVSPSDQLVVHLAANGIDYSGLDWHPDLLRVGGYDKCSGSGRDAYAFQEGMLSAAVG